jgi:hypothetical protein
MREPFYLTDPAVRDWLHRIYSVLEADGSALVQGLGSPNPERRSGHGIPDNCYAADRLLDWFVDNGWIIPVSYNPSREQRFFGVGGRAPGKTQRKPEWRKSHTYPQEWRYRANLESEGLIRFVRRIV